jgi:hypothetical protein
MGDMILWVLTMMRPTHSHHTMTPITTSTEEPTPVVVLFYKYCIPCPSLPDRYPVHYVEEFCRHQRELCARLQLKGRVLFANEGINGAISARREQVLQEYKSAMDMFDLVRDCALPENENGEETGDNEGLRLYVSIDWKQTAVDSELSEPFLISRLVLSKRL